jgi:UDP-N-acetylmuramoyl-tripeptide--D-alanyl-D-alanine ligase
VLNADDPSRVEWQARARTEFVVTFGVDAPADCTVVDSPQPTATGSKFTLRLPDGVTTAVELPLLGPKNVVNALAAAAAAHAAGVTAAEIRAGLEQARPVRGRLNLVRARAGATVIDDTYNANPASMRAALDYLSELSGRRVAVIGDMAELGSEAEALHREIGAYARDRCDDFFAIGEHARETAAAYGKRGLAFDDLTALADALSAMLAGGVTVLVKGSRVMGLERLVAALSAPPDREAEPSC